MRVPFRPRRAGLLALGAAGCVQLGAQAPPASALDWSAPHRWVHVDTVARGSVDVFEGARLRWLGALRAGGRYLPDGRPLFWSGDHEGVRSFVTFWPFGAMAELDARARTISETEAAVGKQALEDYDTGDAALVPPHYSQIWRRSAEDDFVSPLSGALDETTGTHARLQFVQLNLQVAGRVDENWKEVRELLARQRYPLTCRVFSSRYGTGQTMLLWLAADAWSLKQAQALPAFLRAAPREPRGALLADEYAQLWTLQQEWTLARRDDLSNLPASARAAGVALAPIAAGPDFERDVRPILTRRCTPCHEPGGVMYGRLPFDDPAALRVHPEGVLRRLKEPAEKAVLEAFLGPIEGAESGLRP